MEGEAAPTGTRRLVGLCAPDETDGWIVSTICASSPDGESHNAYAAVCGLSSTLVMILGVGVGVAAGVFMKTSDIGLDTLKSTGL